MRAVLNPISGLRFTLTETLLHVAGGRAGAGHSVRRVHTLLRRWFVVVPPQAIQQLPRRWPLRQGKRPVLTN
jgi:hypothetical protein